MLGDHAVQRRGQRVQGAVRHVLQLQLLRPDGAGGAGAQPAAGGRRVPAGQPVEPLGDGAFDLALEAVGAQHHCAPERGARARGSVHRGSEAGHRAGRGRPGGCAPQARRPARRAPAPDQGCSRARSRGSLRSHLDQREGRRRTPPPPFPGWGPAKRSLCDHPRAISRHWWRVPCRWRLVSRPTFVAGTRCTRSGRDLIGAWSRGLSWRSSAWSPDERTAATMTQPVTVIGDRHPLPGDHHRRRALGSAISIRLEQRLVGRSRHRDDRRDQGTSSYGASPGIASGWDPGRGGEPARPGTRRRASDPIDAEAPPEGREVGTPKDTTGHGSAPEVGTRSSTVTPPAGSGAC